MLKYIIASCEHLLPYAIRRPGEESDAESSRETSSAGSSDCEAERRAKGVADGAWSQHNPMNLNSQRMSRLSLREKSHMSSSSDEAEISVLAAQFPEIGMYRSCDLLPEVGCKGQTQLHGSSGRKVYGVDSLPKISLPVFGLASYKLKGSILTPSGNDEFQQASSLLQDAGNWLKRLRLIFLTISSFFPITHNGGDDGAGISLQCLILFQVGRKALVPTKGRKKMAVDLVWLSFVTPGTLPTGNLNSRFKGIWGLTVLIRLPPLFGCLDIQAPPMGYDFPALKRGYQYLFEVSVVFQQRACFNLILETLSSKLQKPLFRLFQDPQTGPPISFSLFCSKWIWNRRLGCRPLEKGGLATDGCPNPKRNDRFRTIWTPEMDRYFIDLMLEQVNKGNRIDDHLFSKRAWKQMTALFNAKFNFQYEKDVLKNRHKTLRNLYKAIKNLLCQRGFSWDEQRQMVTADNNVWDEYIKTSGISPVTSVDDGEPTDIIHESSHSGGNKIVTATQPMSLGEVAVEALHDIMINEEYDISLSKETVDEKPQAPPDQVQKGNQVDGVFRKQAWMEMIASFNAKFGFKYDMDVLKNRFKTLRRQYNVIRSLLDLNGFVWDDTRQMVTADDCVCRIISRELSVDGRDTDLGYDEPDDIPEVKFQGLLKISESPAASFSSEEQLDGNMASALREMVTAVSSISEKNKDDENSGSISIESVIEAVQALPDMDEELVLDACDFLEDEKKAKTFLALDVKLRKKWLIRKLRPQQL
ncbi:hypothetical protein CK203_052002 [Vitis vinifera]|uniref:Myb/SANT-like domain-containing protein n=1 Tax=Vitis vinifera TaxID=29760 RepID=A0A438FXZ8_VITVI|nr:hypothetical protein CK203_052002 [Vitis vinifera]